MNAKQEYFEALAQQWDGFTNAEEVRNGLVRVLAGLAIGRGETVVDLGCGTGILSGVLQTILSPNGRTIGVDFSREMIAIASRAMADARSRWLVNDASTLQIADHSVDRVICFNAWPHFQEPDRVVLEIRRVLKPRGCAHVMHLISRQAIAAVHAKVGGAVANDTLPPVEDLAALFAKHGFTVGRATDTENLYLLSVAVRA